MNEIQALIDFCLKKREDAADWKDDSGQFISLANRAKDGLTEVYEDLGTGCLNCGVPSVKFYGSDTLTANNNYGAGPYCESCMEE
jgi:hypothetical protein